MKSLTTLLCLLLLVTSAQALPDTRPATTQASPPALTPHQAKLAEVREKAARIKVGMKRSEVEALFPTRDGGIVGPNASRYYEDPEVMIEVPFDQTGGNWKPGNLVTGAPKIYRSHQHLD